MELEPVLNHLRLAVRNAVILLPTVFVFGVIAGWGASMWRESWLSAVAGVAIGTAAAAWTTWVYYATRGLLSRLAR